MSYRCVHVCGSTVLCQQFAKSEIPGNDRAHTHHQSRLAWYYSGKFIPIDVCWLSLTQSQYPWQHLTLIARWWFHGQNEITGIKPS